MFGVYFISKHVVPTADEVEKPQTSTKGNFLEQAKKKSSLTLQKVKTLRKEFPIYHYEKPESKKGLRFDRFSVPKLMLLLRYSRAQIE